MIKKIHQKLRDRVKENKLNQQKIQQQKNLLMSKINVIPSEIKSDYKKSSNLNKSTNSKFTFAKNFSSIMNINNKKGNLNSNLLSSIKIEKSKIISKFDVNKSSVSYLENSKCPFADKMKECPEKKLSEMENLNKSDKKINNFVKSHEEDIKNSPEKEKEKSKKNIFNTQEIEILSHRIVILNFDGLSIVGVFDLNSNILVNNLLLSHIFISLSNFNFSEEIFNDRFQIIRPIEAAKIKIYENIWLKPLTFHFLKNLKNIRNNSSNIKYKTEFFENYILFSINQNSLNLNTTHLSNYSQLNQSFGTKQLYPHFTFKILFDFKAIFEGEKSFYIYKNDGIFNEICFHAQKLKDNFYNKKEFSYALNNEIDFLVSFYLIYRNMKK